jgi:hypothetical protein
MKFPTRLVLSGLIVVVFASVLLMSLMVASQRREMAIIQQRVEKIELVVNRELVNPASLYHTAVINQSRDISSLSQRVRHLESVLNSSVKQSLSLERTAKKEEEVSGQMASQFLAEMLSEGIRVVSVVAADPGTSSDRFLYAGCRVDVDLGGEPSPATILRNVLVLNIQYEPSDPSRVRLSLVVKPEDAQAVMEALERGTLSVSLSGPVSKLPSSDPLHR